MQENEEQQSEPTESTSEDSSETEPLTKALRQELNKRLRELNSLIVKTAMASVESSLYMADPKQKKKFKKRLQKKQRAHTDQLLSSLSDSEKLLLLDELRLTTESESSQSNLILPAGSSGE